MTTTKQRTPTRDVREREPSIEPLRLTHIVVGIDGSPNSMQALRLAGRLGVRDGAAIEAVCVYRSHLLMPYPLATVMVPSHGPAGEGTRDTHGPSDDLPDAAADAQATLEQTAREAFGNVTLSNLALRGIDGHERSTHEVLTTMAAGSDLLVVGARGHSGALGLLLGSTAQSCARHAKCAVLVVPSAN